MLRYCSHCVSSKGKATVQHCHRALHYSTDTDVAVHPSEADEEECDGFSNGFSCSVSSWGSGEETLGYETDYYDTEEEEEAIAGNDPQSLEHTQLEAAKSCVCSYYIGQGCIGLLIVPPQLSGSLAAKIALSLNMHMIMPGITQVACSS